MSMNLGRPSSSTWLLHEREHLSHIDWENCSHWWPLLLLLQSVHSPPFDHPFMLLWYFKFQWRICLIARVPSADSRTHSDTHKLNLNCRSVCACVSIPDTDLTDCVWVCLCFALLVHKVTHYSNCNVCRNPFVLFWNWTLHQCNSPTALFVLSVCALSLSLSLSYREASEGK